MDNCNLRLQVFVNSLHKYVTYNESLIDELKQKPFMAKLSTMKNGQRCKIENRKIINLVNGYSITLKTLRNGGYPVKLFTGKSIRQCRELLDEERKLNLGYKKIDDVIEEFLKFKTPGNQQFIINAIVDLVSKETKKNKAIIFDLLYQDFSEEQFYNYPRNKYRSFLEYICRYLNKGDQLFIRLNELFPKQTKTIMMKMKNAF